MSAGERVTRGEIVGLIFVLIVATASSLASLAAFAGGLYAFFKFVL